MLLTHDVRLVIVLERSSLRAAFVRALHFTRVLIFKPFCGLRLRGYAQHWLRAACEFEGKARSFIPNPPAPPPDREDGEFQMANSNKMANSNLTGTHGGQ